MQKTNKKPPGVAGKNFSAPVGTLALAALAVSVYLLSGGGALYVPDSILYDWALDSAKLPASLLSYLLIHVGIIHLVGNMLGLAVFSFIVERRLSARDVLGIFFLSGVLAGAVFVLLNPPVKLAGASAGIAGLMACAILVDPKRAIPALILLPVATSFLLAPFLGWVSAQKESALAGEKTAIEAQVSTFIASNQTERAATAIATLEAKNRELDAQRQGAEREKATPTDFIVHAIGALVGAAYAVAIHRRQVAHSVRELKRALR